MRSRLEVKLGERKTHRRKTGGCYWSRQVRVQDHNSVHDECGKSRIQQTMQQVSGTHTASLDRNIWAVLIYNQKNYSGKLYSGFAEPIAPTVVASMSQNLP